MFDTSEIKVDDVDLSDSNINQDDSEGSILDDLNTLMTSNSENDTLKPVHSTVFPMPCPEYLNKPVVKTLNKAVQATNFTSYSLNWELDPEISLEDHLTWVKTLNSLRKEYSRLFRVVEFEHE